MAQGADLGSYFEHRTQWHACRGQVGLEHHHPGPPELKTLSVVPLMGFAPDTRGPPPGFTRSRLSPGYCITRVQGIPTSRSHAEPTGCHSIYIWEKGRPVLLPHIPAPNPKGQGEESRRATESGMTPGWYNPLFRDPPGAGGCERQLPCLRGVSPQVTPRGRGACRCFLRRTTLPRGSGQLQTPS